MHGIVRKVDWKDNSLKRSEGSRTDESLFVMVLLNSGGSSSAYPYPITAHDH